MAAGRRGPARRYTPRVFLAESIVHTCDRFLFRIHGEFGIRWYGTAYAVGFLLAWWLVRWLGRTGRIRLSASSAGDLVTVLAVGVLAGGRLGHIVFYEPNLLVDFSGSFPFWAVFDLPRGGMSSHGGIIGVGLACAWFARRRRLPALAIGDIACFVAPYGLGLGRIANWINGELAGKVLPASAQADPPWWSVKYPEEMLTKDFVNAHRLTELEWMRTQLGVGPRVPLAQALHDACYRHDAEVIAKVAPLLTARYPINFMQAFTDGVVLPAILVVAWWRPRPSGWIVGWFMLGYGLLRLVTEQYRVPDPDILPDTGVTLPMVLSVVMALVGVALLAARRKGERLYGGVRPGGVVSPDA